MKVGQVALGFGADDMGSVMIEENAFRLGRRYDALGDGRGLRPGEGARQDRRPARHALP